MVMSDDDSKDSITNRTPELSSHDIDDIVLLSSNSCEILQPPSPSAVLSSNLSTSPGLLITQPIIRRTSSSKQLKVYNTKYINNPEYEKERLLAAERKRRFQLTPSERVEEDRRYRQRYKETFSRIQLHDIRTEYPLIYANSVNMHDMSMLDKFFQQFCHVDVTYRDILSPKLFSLPFFINIHGIYNVSKEICSALGKMPDVTLTVHNSQIIRNIQNRRSKVILTATFKGSMILPDTSSDITTSSQNNKLEADNMVVKLGREDAEGDSLIFNDGKEMALNSNYIEELVVRKDVFDNKSVLYSEQEDYNHNDFAMSFPPSSQTQTISSVNTSGHGGDYYSNTKVFHEGSYSDFIDSQEASYKKHYEILTPTALSVSLSSDKEAKPAATNSSDASLDNSRFNEQLHITNLPQEYLKPNDSKLLPLPSDTMSNFSIFEMNFLNQVILQLDEENRIVEITIDGRQLHDK